MKKIILSLVLSVYVLTGCTNTPDEGVAREYAKPVMEGEITIATMFENHFVEEAAELFMQKYPDITVTINTGIYTNDFMITGGEDFENFDNDAYMVAIENYITQLNMSLMNGSAEDIFITDNLPVQNYINMGVLEDLSFYLENSPEINDDSHFMNIINAFKDDESKIWQLALDFDMYSIVFFDRHLVEESGLSIGEDVKCMSYLEALDFGISLLENTNREDAYLSHGFFSVFYTILDGSID